MTALRYKKDLIKEDVDCRLLPAWLGLRTNRTGNTLFCECVSRSHKETRIDHVSVRKEGAHCFLNCPGCRRSFDAFGMVMEAKGKDFAGACEELIAFLGTGRDRYTDAPETKKTVRFPYPKELLALYGFDGAAFGILKAFYEKDPEAVRRIIDYKGGETVARLRQIRKDYRETPVAKECDRRLKDIRRFLEEGAGN